MRLMRLLTLLLVALMAGQHTQARKLQQEDTPDEAAPSMEAPALEEDWLAAAADAGAPTPAPAPAPEPEEDLSPSPSPSLSPSPSPETDPESPSPEPESPSPSPEAEDQSPSPPAEEPRESRRDGQPSYTTGTMPSTDGFKPYPVDPAFRGTCDIKTTDDNLGRCDDDMGDLGDGTTPADFKLMHDADQAARCGIVPAIDDIVNGLAERAYSGKYGGCGITSYTITRACVGQGAKEGHWRVRVLLWPDSDSCEPLCMKMRGLGDSANDYGRTATC